ncbi:Protein NRT1/ PTR FAMILY 3.1 [Dichanthelium oligosanthes]|uniref:Protein NRT1/ PTR FAMILY 3.1 n=1 Tax=Dichanthelium oligosanthes TaxID=888268 RepID=A0A1E5VG03_9POAL|nr:Protein NRT1/ PTR FAMILY 3.1 [Dichanthelium oligosanthes]
MATATPTVDRNNADVEQKKRRKGGFRTMPLILASEVCDRFALAGFNANLITYLTQQLHLPLVEASNTLTNFAGTSALTPVLGALVADSFAGRFWTIIAGSVFYQVGMLGLVVSAVLPSLRSPPCSSPAAATAPCQRASGWQLAVLYLSLLCTALGSGGIRPCVVPFGADQFGGGQQHRRRYFNLYFFTMGFAVLLALTVVVYIQDNVGWGWGFGIPAIGMFVSILLFLAGYPLYVLLRPGGSPFTRLAQVVAAAFKKWNAAVPEDPDLLYQDKELDALISTNGRLLHTNQLTFFDRAAIVTPGDISAAGQPDLWRLSTVHRVEELKSIVRLLPIWSATILLATAESHTYTFTVMQARTMDRHVDIGGHGGHFQIPPATMAVFSTVAMLLTLAFYDRGFVPLARRVTGLPSGITYFHRMGVGLALYVLGVGAAALVETRRRDAAARHGLLDAPDAVVPLSVFWLVPQFAVPGVGDAFASVGLMEFLYDQAPESMRSSAVALFWLAGSIGDYMGTVLVTAVQRATRRRGEWLQDNINRGRIDNYYWLVTCILVINLCYYLICFHFYTMKPLEEGGHGGHGEKECELSSLPENGGAAANGMMA